MSFAQMLYASAAVPAPETTITNVTWNENRNQGRNHAGQAQNRNQQTDSSYLPTPISRGVTPVSLVPTISNSSVSSGSGRNNGVEDYNHGHTLGRGGRAYGYSGTSYDAQPGYDEGYDDDDAYGGMGDMSRGVSPAPAPASSLASAGMARSASVSTRASGHGRYGNADTPDVGDRSCQAGRVGSGRGDEQQRSGGAHADYAHPPIVPYSYSATTSASASASESASLMASSFDVERERELALARLERGSAGSDAGSNVRSANTRTGQSDFVAYPVSTISVLTSHDVTSVDLGC